MLFTTANRKLFDPTYSLSLGSKLPIQMRRSSKTPDELVEALKFKKKQ